MPESRNAGELIALVISAVEDKLNRTDLMSHKCALAYSRAQAHLYESLFWLEQAGQTESPIVRPR